MNDSPKQNDSLMQTLQNLSKEREERKSDLQEETKKLRAELHALVGFPRYNKHANAFYYSSDQIVRYLKIKYRALQMPFSKASDYIPIAPHYCVIIKKPDAVYLELQEYYDPRIRIDTATFLVFPQPGNPMYNGQKKNGLVLILDAMNIYGQTNIYWVGDDSNEHNLTSDILHILEQEEPPEFLPPELAQKIKKKPIVETNQDDSLQYKKGKKYKKKNKFEIEIF